MLLIIYKVAVAEHKVNIQQDSVTLISYSIFTFLLLKNLNIKGNLQRF